MTDRTVVYNGVSWEDLAASRTSENVWVRLSPAEESRKPLMLRVTALAKFSQRNGGLFQVKGVTEDGTKLSLTGSSHDPDKPAEFTL